MSEKTSLAMGDEVAALVEKRDERLDAEKHHSIWTVDFARIFLASLLLHLGLQMANGILPRYADILGASASEVGLISSLFAVTALLLKVIAGPAIDSQNRKVVLASALAVMTFSFVGYAFSNTIEEISLYSLLRGAAQAFTVTCSLVIATDCLPENRLAEGLSIYSLSHALCQAAGPMIALNISLVVGYENTFLISAAIEVIAIIWVLTMKRESRGAKPFLVSLEGIVAKEALLPVMMLLLLQMSNCAITAFLVLCGLDRGMPQSQLGLYFTVYAMSLIVIRPFVGGFADRYGFKKAVAPGLVLFALSFVALSVATSLPIILFAAVLAAFGYGASQPIVQALSMRLTPPERHGAASCTCYIGSDVGAILGPNVAGLIVDSLGYSTMWLFMIAPIVGAIMILLFSRKMQQDVKKA